MPDFLVDFLRTKVPKDWYAMELEKPLADRHPIAQWYWRYCEFTQRSQGNAVDGIFSGEPDGPSLAFLVLAHELYVIDDNMLLQQHLIRRLLHPAEFQGARYELTVAATMIRAGFDLVMEAEDDPSTTHPEFIATHRGTGVRVAVEAKSRRRPRVLGHPGTPTKPIDNLAEDIRRLFRGALRKATDLPLFVFIDANLPPEAALALSTHWGEQFQRMVFEVARPIDRNGVVVNHPHNLLLVTNVGHHHGEPAGRQPGQLVYSHWPLPQHTRHPVDPRLIQDVEHAMQLYGKIPNSFD